MSRFIDTVLDMYERAGLLPDDETVQRINAAIVPTRQPSPERAVRTAPPGGGGAETSG
jgi:hypothetical protein